MTISLMKTVEMSLGTPNHHAFSSTAHCLKLSISFIIWDLLLTLPTVWTTKSTTELERLRPTSSDSVLGVGTNTTSLLKLKVRVYNCVRSECSQPRWFGHVTGMPKDWRGKSCWLYPRERGPEVDHEPDGVIAYPTLLGSILVWSQQNYEKFLKIMRYFWTS